MMTSHQSHLKEQISLKKKKQIFIDKIALALIVYYLAAISSRGVMTQDHQDYRVQSVHYLCHYKTIYNSMLYYAVLKNSIMLVRLLYGTMITQMI